MHSNVRWGPLWERRRRGLVKERIEAERTDHIRRIHELETKIYELELGLGSGQPDRVPPGSKPSEATQRDPEAIMVER